MNNLETFKKYESQALDLSASVWISASAGGGKTTLIVKRILKLIVQSIINPKMFHVEHSKIIALTYTNEAANEIKNRIGKKLYDWQNDNDILEHDISLIFEKNFTLSNEVKDRCKKLFKEKIHLQIHVSSFHSFCFKIIEDLKLFGNIDKKNIIDESQSKSILKKIVIDQLITNSKKTRSRTNCSTWNNLSQNKTLIHKIENVPRGTFSYKEYPKNKIIDLKNYNESSIKMFHVEHFYNNTNIEKKMIDFSNCSTWNNLKKRVDKFIKCSTWNIFDIVNKKNQDTLYIKKLNTLFKKEININTLVKNINVKALLTEYTEYKTTNNYIDFDDIVSKLDLELDQSHNKEWILYEINKKIQHLIIDEAQDNSNMQWNLIKKIISDFLDSENTKTFFIVGDIKQSIYGFQGAKPQLFLETQKYFTEIFRLYKKKIIYIEWNFSFRVPQNTLNFIDDYFNQKQLTSDLTLNFTNSLKHIGFNENLGEILNTNYNKVKKTTNSNKVNKLTNHKIKVNLSNCSTWNNLSQNKTLIHKIENVPRGTFSYKEYPKNKIIDLKNYNESSIKMFHVEHFYNNTNIEKKMIDFSNCSTWNNLKKRVDEFIKCSMWNNCQKANIEEKIYKEIKNSILSGINTNEIMILFRSRSATMKNLISMLRKYKIPVYQKNKNQIESNKIVQAIQLINKKINCSTWNNLSQNKTLIHKIENVPRGTFSYKEYPKNKIIDLKNYNESSIKMFHVEHFYNNTNIEKKMIDFSNCSTWNNLKERVDKFIKCSTWNIFDIVNKKNQDTLYIKKLNTLFKKEININKLISMIQKTNKTLPYYTILLKIQFTLKKHLNSNLAHKLINIAQQLSKQKKFSIMNFNSKIQNSSTEIQHKNQDSGIKILTIHAAKGLESKVVIFVNDILKKQKNDILPEEDRSESTRLIYVALTRTKDKLIIIET